MAELDKRLSEYIDKIRGKLYSSKDELKKRVSEKLARKGDVMKLLKKQKDLFSRVRVIRGDEREVKKVIDDLLEFIKSRS